MTGRTEKISSLEEARQAYHNFLAARGLTARAGQQEMMSFCYSLVNAIQQGKDKAPSVGVVEAGTGTGKTLGYSLPLIPLAKELGKTLIISTATVALQEQIVHKDIPDIQRNSGLNFSYLLAKGRGRYFCPMRCEAEMDAQQEAYDYVKRDIQGLYNDFKKDEWNGEREGFPEVIEDSLWGKINAVSSQCARKNCAHYKTCPFFKARSRMEEADVIIANHDLVLADIDLAGGVILPAPESAIYVFDEGHHLTDKAIDHFAADASLDKTVRWLNDIPDQVMSLPALFGEKMEEHVLKLAHLCSDTGTELTSVRRFLIEALPFREDMPNSEIYRFPEGDIPPAVCDAFNIVKPLINQMITIVGKMDCMVDEAGSHISQEDIAKGKMAVGAIAHRLDTLAEAIRRFAFRPAAAPAVPVARWVSIKHYAKGGRGTEMIIHSSPVHAGERLNRDLWEKAYGAIVTSATIRSMGKFDSYLEKAGLKHDTPTMLAKSPFDYEKNGVLFIPRMKHSPKDEQQHTAEISEMIPKLVLRKKGCLVLFTSKRQMTAVYESMPEEVKSHVLLQGSLPKSEIVARHKLRIDRGEQSVIFGMASFSEGVDLPGDYCNNVIISKLPFSVPTDPISMTLSEWMRKHNRDTFAEISVPEACLKLIQAVGRLIRTETDTGAVTILDPRLKNSRYGQDILNALPPFRREIR